MIKLKNISQSDVTLQDLGMQLLRPNELVELDGMRKNQAADSSQVLQLLTNGVIAVIDNDDVQISDLSLAIDIVKGYSQKSLHTFDQKLFVHETSRPLGTTTYFTSEGDDLNDPTAIGGGERMVLEHNIGDPVEQFKIIDFNLKENRSWMHEGYVMWEKAVFDTVCMKVIPTLTTYSPGTNTFFNPYGPIVVPAAGDGHIDIQPQDIRLVEMPPSFDEGVRPTAFWDADYDSNTHQFSNIRPNLLGKGIYNMFIAEVVLSNIVNHILLLNEGFIMLQSGDVSEIGHGMRLKLVLNTVGDDHEWKAACILTMQRTRV